MLYGNHWVLPFTEQPTAFGAGFYDGVFAIASSKLDCFQLFYPFSAEAALR